MPDEIIGLEYPQEIGDIKPGAIVGNWSLNKEKEKTVHYVVRGVRDLMEDISKLYSSNKKPTRNDFVKVMGKHSKKRDDDITDYLDRIENEDELFKVVKRKELKSGKITLELEKISNKEKMKLIRSITDKLLKKIKPEHVKSMIEEGIKKNNDIEILKKIDRKLNSKKSVKVEGKKGCYKFVIDGLDLFTIG